MNALEKAVEKAAKIESTEEASRFYHDTVLEGMTALRTPADKMEALCGEKYWPYPTYEQLLFYVK